MKKYKKILTFRGFLITTIEPIYLNDRKGELTGYMLVGSQRDEFVRVSVDWEKLNNPQIGQLYCLGDDGKVWLEETGMSKQDIALARSPAFPKTGVFTKDVTIVAVE